MFSQSRFDAEQEEIWRANHPEEEQNSGLNSGGSSNCNDSGHVPISGSIPGSSFDNGAYNLAVDIKRALFG